MASTATAISDSQLEAELRQLQTEAASVRKKLDDDTNKLAAARAERQRIVDGIARGTVKESDAQRVKADIETIEIRIEGYTSLLATNRSKIDELGKELYWRQAATAKAAREKEFAELQQRGAGIAQKILEQLTRLTAEDIPALDAVRVRLGREFQDLDGEGAATRLREMLWKPAGPQEALHEPDVHLRKLVDQGWEFLPRVPGGGGLRLSVYSMRPKR
jgi:citrate synthase